MKIDKIVLGFSISDAELKLKKSQQDFTEAKKLARHGQFRLALESSQRILQRWSNYPSLLERVYRWAKLSNLLEDVRAKYQQWESSVNQANRFAFQARSHLESDSGNPRVTREIQMALDLYRKSYAIVKDSQFKTAIQYCRSLLEFRQNYCQTVKNAEKLAADCYYKLALEYYQHAQQQYHSSEVESAMAFVYSQIPKEVEYETQLQQAYELARAERWDEAIAEVEAALRYFSRADGKQLLSQFHGFVNAKSEFELGLTAERANYFALAELHYQRAIDAFPNSIECQTRWGIIALKQYRPEEARSRLQNIHTHRAAYLRGFAYFQQKDWQNLRREWQNLQTPEVNQQRESVKIAATHDRLQHCRTIEQAIDNRDLETARSIAETFMQKYGEVEPVVTNLERHIKPRIECQHWQNKNWQQIANMARERFEAELDLVSLHNWAIANYYFSKTNPNALSDFIVSGMMALANLDCDPVFDQLHWLDGKKLDRQEVARELEQAIENAIHEFKDKDLNHYLHLRDLYRRDRLILDRGGIQVGQFCLTPGIYQRYRDRLSEVTIPVNLLGCLYTDWGLAVAACLEGDFNRAKSLTPAPKPLSQSEQLARDTVAYRFGCHCLEQNRWREAFKQFNLARSQLQIKTEWRNNLNRLCRDRSQEIDDFQDRISFGELWHSLLETPDANRYLVESKAKAIADKISRDKIAESEALEQLRELQQRDRQNPTVGHFIEQLEINQEGRKIQALMDREQFEAALRLAKQSRHQRIRYVMADLCVSIAVDGVNSGRLPLKAAYELGTWAHQLCPDEPSFIPFYQQLGIR